MSNGTGQTPKKETVYSGPTPPMDNQAFAKEPTAGTTGTVYGGPTPTQGTVYGGASATITSAKVPVRSGISPAVLNSANWFFYIAALSIVSSFVAMSSGVSLQFGTGLGISRTIDAAFAGSGSTAFIINLVIAGVLAAFGYFARQGQKWAFLVGMILYAGDGVLLFMDVQIRGIIFHGLVLFFIFRGFSQLD